MRERAAGEVVRGLLGAYTIRRKHGEGGFGVTYDATTQSSGERVILKELRFERLREWKSLELFEREGHVLAEISHPAIPSYRDFFALAGDRPFPARELTSYSGEDTLSVVLVQTFVDGPTLAARVENEGPLEAPELERVLREMLFVLAYLHGLTPPVIHRDINPKNLLASRDGRVFLVDFGAIQDRLRAASSGGSTTVGTLGYMPLEQLRGDARPASDIYALGVSLLVCATGSAPTDLPVDNETGKIRVDSIAGRLPPRMRRALDAMVEPIVGHRAPSARHVLAILDEAPARLPAPSAATWLGGGVGVVLLVAGVAVGVVLRRKPPPRMSPPVTVAAPLTPVPPVPPVPPVSPRRTGPVATVVPSGPLASPAQLTWKATVSSASGISLSPGAACSITTLAIPSGKDPDLAKTRVVCGAEVLYDQDVPLEGTSMFSAGIHETPVAERASVFHAALVFSDIGTRVGKAQASIDTSKKQALVFRDTVPVYRVTLAVEPFTAQREGLPLDGRLTPPFDHVVERVATVTAARGQAPARVGAKCALKNISPAFSSGETCRTTLRCGTTLLYGVGETGYADCAIEGREPVAFTDDEPTSKGGDPRAKIDLTAGTASFSDDVPAVYELEMSLSPAR